MALVALEIPKVGLVMESARLVRWLKSVGDMVQQGEALLELETEKSVVEIESTETGRLVEILLQPDQEAQVGDKIAWLENGVVATEPSPVSPSAAKVPIAAKAATPELVTQPARHADRVISSPAARRFAAEHAIDLRMTAGTGPGGRVQLADVQHALESQSAPSVPSDLEPLSGMRRALARSMTLSNASIPQFTVERAVDWTMLDSARHRWPAGEPRPSLNDYLLQGVSRALLSHPALNVTFWGEVKSPLAGVIPAKGTHIGLVVAVADGLLVPIFHEVERLTLQELTRRRGEIIARALQGHLKQEELQGGTFSISNLGKAGPDRFQALISPPQSAILAVGRRRDCLVAHNGSPQVRPMSALTLTVDHRVADGRLASQFLASLVDILEEPVA